MTAPAGLTLKQQESVSQSTAIFNVWEGAVASGKTIGSLFRWVLFIHLTWHLPGALVMSGRTRDAVWRNAIMPMMDHFPGMVQGNLGAPTCRILGKTVYVIGASDIRSEEVIRGMTVLGAYVDEITTLPEGYFKMLGTRLRVSRKDGNLASKLFGTTNPDNPHHWLMKDYLSRLDDPKIGKAWKRFHFTIDDNPTLSPEYVETMKSQYTGLWYKRFILGQWVMAEGAIYQSWDEDTMVVDELPRIDEVISCGMDYGTTNPTRGVLIGRSGEDLIVMDEWAPKTGQSDPALSSSLRDWLQEGGYAPQWFPIDPSAASFRRILRDDGLDGITSASNKVLSGIRVVDAVMATGHLKVHRRCEHLIAGLNSYVWDSKATERGLDAPLKVDDHEADALRYALYSTRSQWGPHIPVTLPTSTED